MYIKTKEPYSAEHATLSVDHYTQRHLLHSYSDGTLEQNTDRIRQVGEAFGRLIETLADKGLLDASEIQHIVRGWQFDTDIKLVKTP